MYMYTLDMKARLQPGAHMGDAGRKVGGEGEAGKL